MLQHFYHFTSEHLPFRAFVFCVRHFFKLEKAFNKSKKITETSFLLLFLDLISQDFHAVLKVFLFNFGSY